MNACGGCTACCTIMRVEMQPEPKPARCRCEHAIKHGCAIYDTRPEPCREWACMWRISQDEPGIRMASALRPDRSGVVLELNTAGNIVAHLAKPHSWKLEPARSWLLDFAKRHRVILEDGERVQLLKANGDVDALAFVGVDPATNERKYVRERDHA